MAREGGDRLWRGDLSPLGCEAALRINVWRVLILRLLRSRTGINPLATTRAARLNKGIGFLHAQKRKNPLSRVFVKLKIETLSLNWCPEEDSNFHDLAVTST